MKHHIQIVAAIHVAFGILSIFSAIVAFTVFGLLSDAAVKAFRNAIEQDPQAQKIIAHIDDQEFTSLVRTGTFAAGALLALIALLQLLGGMALFVGYPWGRPLVLVLGVLQLMNIPFGTIVGVYTLWALLQEPRPQYLREAPAQATT